MHQSTDPTRPVNPASVTPPDVQAGADQATLDKALEVAAKLADATKTLDLCVAAFRQGETAMCAGRLEAGRLAELYVKQRMACGHKREAAVQKLEGELATWSSDVVDGARLIRAYHTYRLLALETAKEAGEVSVMPYGHYRNELCQLVERKDKDTPAESWILLPGFEDRARKLFTDCVVNGWNRATCHDHIEPILRDYAAAQAEQTARDATAAQEKAAAEKVKADAAKQQQKAAELVEKAAKEALAAAAEEKKDELTAALEAANKAKLLAQRNAVELAAAKQQADREAAAAEQRRKAAEKAAAPKEPRTPRTPAARPEPEQHGKPPVHNPLVAAKNATAKDLASSLVAQVEANTHPRQVLEEFARLVRWNVKDAKPFVRGLMDSAHKGTAEFCFTLAECLMDSLPEQEEAPAAKVA